MPLMLLASGTVQRNTASVKLSILREGEATERLPWTTRPGYVPSASPPSPVSPPVTRYIADTFKMAARRQPSMSVREQIAVLVQKSSLAVPVGEGSAAPAPYSAGDSTGAGTATQPTSDKRHWGQRDHLVKARRPAAELICD